MLHAIKLLREQGVQLTKMGGFLYDAIKDGPIAAKKMEKLIKVIDDPKYNEIKFHFYRAPNDGVHRKIFTLRDSTPIQGIIYCVDGVCQYFHKVDNAEDN